jgi:hypothetical protein
MRTFVAVSCEYEITEENAEALIESGALYFCGKIHDLHLTPDHKFSLRDVEILLRANE